MQYGNEGVTIRTDSISFGGEDLSEATTLARNELYFTDRINDAKYKHIHSNGINSRKYISYFRWHI